MNKKEKKQRIEQIKALFDKWIPRLGLKWFSIEIIHYSKRKHYMQATEKGPNSVMVASCSWEYMRATIYVCIPNTEGMSDRKLEWTVVHELMHVFLNEMRGANKNVDAEFLAHEERVASMLADAVIWTTEGIDGT